MTRCILLMLVANLGLVIADAKRALYLNSSLAKGQASCSITKMHGPFSANVGPMIVVWGA
jgi:hypothetical protein